MEMNRYEKINNGQMVPNSDNEKKLREIRQKRHEAQLCFSSGAGCTVGLKADGALVATKYTGDLKYGQFKGTGWRDIVAVSAGTWYTVGLKADGTVVTVGRNSDGQRNVSDWRLFRQLDTLEQEREETRGAARIAAERRTAGLCQHCGGELKGFFSKKCTTCGKPKDY